MVGKIKNISSKPISVEDLIGDPKTTEPLPVNTTSAIPAGLPKPVQSTGTPTTFVPGIVSGSLPNNGLSNNGIDRYQSLTPTKSVTGFLDIMSEGHGFLRPKFIPGEGDIYISQSQIRKFQLREGDEISGQARLPKENERYLGLLKVEKVNGITADDSTKRPYFEDLTPSYPNKQIKLETEKTPLSTRIMDLLSPIGFGQRGLIVSPPKAGKTTILKEIAHGISITSPFTNRLISVTSSGRSPINTAIRCTLG